MGLMNDLVSMFDEAGELEHDICADTFITAEARMQQPKRRRTFEFGKAFVRFHVALRR